MIILGVDPAIESAVRFLIIYINHYNEGLDK